MSEQQGTSWRDRAIAAEAELRRLREPVGEEELAEVQRTLRIAGLGDKADIVQRLAARLAERDSALSAAPTSEEVQNVITRLRNEAQDGGPYHLCHDAADLLESLARHVVELERQLADAESTNYREYSAALERIKELERQLADHAHFQRFFDKYALGSKTVPSCLVCGKAGWPPGIHHGDLPGIVVCVPCANAPRELANAQESARKNAEKAEKYDSLVRLEQFRAAGGEHG